VPALGSLKGLVQFRAVQQDGRRSSIAGVSLAVQPSSGSSRLGLAVRASGAVERNRVKRRLRAAVRDALALSPGQADIFVRADARAAVVPYQELVEFLQIGVTEGQKP